MLTAPNAGALAVPLNRFLKRVLDVSLSLPVVVLVLPLASLLVLLLQRLQSPGPLFCNQRRVGLGGRLFNCLKFRTMSADNHNSPVLSAADKPSVYPAGRWLRRRSIDELPQFLNVLAGSMSVVGPRPYLSKEDCCFSSWVDDYALRAMVKPGITGLAQASGLRGKIETREQLLQRLTADLVYIREWSFSMDCLLVWRTIWQIGFPPPTAI